MSVSTLPQVSLISSWFVPPWSQWQKNEDLPALLYALEQQILLHDLYFMHPADIAWYARVAGLPPATRESPLVFVSELTAEQLDRIAAALTQYLADNYQGRLIGPRPRFTALATYWPSINTPDTPETTDAEADGKKKLSGKARRELSVKAVRNSLYLAMKLGCHRVEIVGGSALPDDEEPAQSPEAAIQLRRTVLVQSLIEVFTGPEANRLFGELAESDHRLKICMEIEPGVCFLLKDVAAFKAMHDELARTNTSVAQRVLLNIDVAHMMLTEAEEKRNGATENRSGAAVQLALIQQPEIKRLVGHMHISDHTRSHASDLTPGTYHFYTDFDPWLRLAVELTQQATYPNFSEVVAVEMEACADIHEAARAIGRTRRWIQHASTPDEGHPPPLEQPHEAPPHDAQLSTGAIIVFDIGNSTECLTAHGELEEGAKLLEKLVGEMCRVIHAGKGSAWSFTGDGLIAHFDADHFLNDDESAANSAFTTCEKLSQAAREFVKKQPQETQNLDALSVRIGMHWGSIFVPTGGSLRFEAFGKDVVVACRVCDFVKVLEKATPVNDRKAMSLGFMTQAFHQQLTNGNDSLQLHGPESLKGVGEQTLHKCKF